MKPNDEHATIADLSKELIDFLLALCWVLEKHSDRVTLERGDKTRICFRPLTEPIGYEKKPQQNSSRKCTTPVLIYLIRFLTGYVVPGKDEHDLEMKKIFFGGISLELASKLLECMKGENTQFLDPYVLDIISRTAAQSLFYRGETPKKGEKFWYANSFYIMRIKGYLQKQGCDEWVHKIARLVYLGHFNLMAFNPNLGLGLRMVPCIERSRS